MTNQASDMALAFLLLIALNVEPGYGATPVIYVHQDWLIGLRCFQIPLALKKDW